MIKRSRVCDILFEGLKKLGEEKVVISLNCFALIEIDCLLIFGACLPIKVNCPAY